MGHGLWSATSRRPPRIKEPAEGIFTTIVNGAVLLEEGRHTGALPGRVLRNSRYEQNRRSNAGPGSGARVIANLGGCAHPRMTTDWDHRPVEVIASVQRRRR